MSESYRDSWIAADAELWLCRAKIRKQKKALRELGRAHQHQVLVHRQLMESMIQKVRRERDLLAIISELHEGHGMGFMERARWWFARERKK